MISFLKKIVSSTNKEIVISAPCNGVVKRISEVSDEVFKEGVLGDGFFIIPKDNDFYAPASGIVKNIAKTKHAFTIELDGSKISILMHIGIDSVEAKGKGFNLHIEEGAHVTPDTKMVTIDPKILKKYAKSLETPIIVFKETLSVNGNKHGKIITLIKEGNVAYKDSILTIK